MITNQMGQIRTFRDFIKEVEKKGLLDAYYCGCSMLITFDNEGKETSEAFSVCLCDEAINKSKEAQ